MATTHVVRPNDAPTRVAFRALLLGAFLVATFAASARAGEHRIGLGAMYWRSLDDLSAAGLESDGFAPSLTYQYVPAGIFKFEADLEYYGKGFGGSESAAYSPVVFVIAEFGIYAGVGVGVTVSDDLPDNVSDPFYCARVGWDFQLVPKVHFDLNANYRADTFKGLEEGYNQDTVTFGAAARVAF
jgi:hypothetical protein